MDTRTHKRKIEDIRTDLPSDNTSLEPLAYDRLREKYTGFKPTDEEIKYLTDRFDIEDAASGPEIGLEVILMTAQDRNIPAEQIENDIDALIQKKSKKLSLPIIATAKSLEQQLFDLYDQVDVPGYYAKEDVPIPGTDAYIHYQKKVDENNVFSVTAWHTFKSGSKTIQQELFTVKVTKNHPALDPAPRPKNEDWTLQWMAGYCTGIPTFFDICIATFCSYDSDRNAAKKNLYDTFIYPFMLMKYSGKKLFRVREYPKEFISVHDPASSKEISLSDFLKSQVSKVDQNRDSANVMQFAFNNILYAVEKDIREAVEYSNGFRLTAQTPR